MNILFGIFIIIAIVSILLALVSLITEKTIFFIKNPSTAKALSFWFASAIFSVIILTLMK